MHDISDVCMTLTSPIPAVCIFTILIVSSLIATCWLSFPGLPQYFLWKNCSKLLSWSFGCSVLSKPMTPFQQIPLWTCVLVMADYAAGWTSLFTCNCLWFSGIWFLFCFQRQSCGTSFKIITVHRYVCVLPALFTAHYLGINILIKSFNRKCVQEANPPLKLLP